MAEFMHRRSGLLSLIASTAALAAFSVLAAPLAAANGVEAASRSFDDAQYRKDAAALRRILAGNMIYIRGSGEVAGRGAFIAGFADPDVKFAPFEITNRSLVPLSRTVVVVTGEGRIRGRDGNKPFVDHFRFSDTFAQRRGEWKVVFVQVTRLATP